MTKIHKPPRIVLPVPKLKGRYRFDVLDKELRSKQHTSWSKNLILDACLDQLGVGGIASQCQVGSGNIAPNVNQISLQSLVATTSTVQSNESGVATDAEGMYAWYRRKFRFAQGVAQGNLSEVGIRNTVSTSRSLIKDENDVPVTLTVLAEDFLDVTWECQLRINTTPINSVINASIEGVVTPVSFVLQPALVSEGTSGHWNQQLGRMLDSGVTSTGHHALTVSAYADGATLGAVTGSPSGSVLVDQKNMSYLAGYTAGSYSRTARAAFSISDGASAFKAFLIRTPVGTWQMLIDPAIPKTNEKIFTMDVTMAWARNVS